jgi:hypothetical protein
LRAAIEIVDSKSNAPIATLKRNWSGRWNLGLLRRTDHADYFVGFLAASSVFSDHRRPVLRIRSREKTVQLPNESQLPEVRLMLLVIFAWHLMQPASEDASSVAAVVAATS